MVEVRREVGGGARVADTEGHLDARVEQAGDAAARDPRVGIFECDDDPRDAGLDQRVGARRRAPVVRTGLERDVRGRAAGPIARVAQRHDLGVRPAGRFGCAAAGDLAVAHDDAADPWVGCAAAASAGAGIQRLVHRLVVAHGTSPDPARGARRRRRTRASRP